MWPQRQVNTMCNWKSLRRGLRFHSAAAVSAGAVTAQVTPLTALAQEAGQGFIGTTALPRDLSPWGMYLSADTVVKVVLIGLVFASVVTWTVWLAKSLEILLAKRRVRVSLRMLKDVRSLAEGADQLASRPGEVREFLDAAAAELQL